MINTKIDCGNMNPEGQEMGGLWDKIVSTINTPSTKAAVQKAINVNKDKAISAAIAQGSNIVGGALAKSGATNKAALDAISKVSGAVTTGAQASLWETHKNKVFIGAGILAVVAGVLAYKKYKK